MKDEFAEENMLVEVCVTIDGDLETFIIYVNENASDYEVLEKCHEEALLKYGNYSELEFERI